MRNGDSFIVAMEVIINTIRECMTFISRTITRIINKKRVGQRMEALDYTAYKQKRKKSYTRNLILDEQILLKIREDDSGFNGDAFKNWAKESFIKLQEAWTKKDIDAVRSRLDVSLYEHYKLLLEANLEENQINIIKVEKVNYVDFSSYSIDHEKEIIEVAINAVLYDYIIEEKTNKIIEGSKKSKVRTTYKLNFYRKIGTKTDEEKYDKCPNCGAELNLEQNKCEYCNVLIVDGMKEWLLNNIYKY